MTHSNAFFARGSELPFESHGEVMAVEIPQNKEISERGTTDGKNESVLLSIKKERVKGAYTLRKKSNEKLFSEMLTPT